MTAEPRWIGKKALLLLHEESLAIFGGASGLTPQADFSVPRWRVRGTRTSTIPKARWRILRPGLAKNHAFVDGN